MKEIHGLPRQNPSTSNEGVLKMTRGLIEGVGDCQASRHISNVMTLKTLVRNAFYMLLAIVGAAALLGLIMPVNH